MRLKKILTPNNKDGDSRCVKSSATQRHGSLKEKGELALHHN